MRWLFVFLVFQIAIPSVCMAEKPIPAFRVLGPAYDVDIHFSMYEEPFNLFTFIKTTKQESILEFTAPFGVKENLILAQRFAVSRFPQVSVVKTIRAIKYDDKLFQFDVKALREKGIFIESREKKIFGSPGELFYIRHEVRDGTYYEWIAVFGSESQVNVVATIFPDYQEVSLGDMLRRMVEHAELSNRPI